MRAETRSSMCQCSEMPAWREWFYLQNINKCQKQGFGSNWELGLPLRPRSTPSMYGRPLCNMGGLKPMQISDKEFCERYTKKNPFQNGANIIANKLNVRNINTYIYIYMHVSNSNCKNNVHNNGTVGARKCIAFGYTCDYMCPCCFFFGFHLFCLIVSRCAVRGAHVFTFLM